MNKLEGIKEGDTVEVTIRGTATLRDRNALTINVVDEAIVPFIESEIASPHFSIKKVERPLQVGDRVRRIHDVVEWEVAAPPRTRTDGPVEVVLWRDGAGYVPENADSVERVS